MFAQRGRRKTKARVENNNEVDGYERRETFFGKSCLSSGSMNLFSRHSLPSLPYFTHYDYTQLTSLWRHESQRFLIDRPSQFREV